MMKRIIAFFVLIALFIIPVSVFADTYGLGSFINEYKHYMVATRDGHGGYQVFCTNADNPSELIRMDDEDGYYIRVTGNGVVRYYTEDYGVTWSSGIQIGPTLWPTGKADGVSKPINESTFNVLTPSGRVFFSPIAHPILMMILTIRRMDFGTILRTFSAGLIPLIGLLILAISLIKAWGFLKNLLTH